jgi:hypothetical protein
LYGFPRRFVSQTQLGVRQFQRIHRVWPSIGFERDDTEKLSRAAGVYAEFAEGAVRMPDRLRVKKAMLGHCCAKSVYRHVELPKFCARKHVSSYCNSPA